MELREKYNSQKEEQEKPDPKKITISNEAYAILEAIEQLKNVMKLKLR